MSLQGKRQLQARLTAIGKTEVMLRQVAVQGVAEAKSRVPRKTANLARTIRIGRVTRTNVSLFAGGVRSVGYAAYVELGTRPHDIVPRTRQALAWGGARRLSGSLRSGAKPTNFAKRVHHPGTKAKPFLRPGLMAAAETATIKSVVKLWNGAA